MQQATKLETILTKRFELAQDLESTARLYRAKCTEYADFHKENFDILRMGPQEKFFYVNQPKLFGYEVLGIEGVAKPIAEQIADDNERIRTARKGDQ